jgi:hypothetical protein
VIIGWFVGVDIFFLAVAGFSSLVELRFESNSCSCFPCQE